MKTILLLFFFFTSGTTVIAQDSWKVMHNGKAKLQTTEEDKAKNSISLNTTDLKKNSYLGIVYTEEEKRKDWKRFIALVDEKEKELVKGTGSSLKVLNTKLLSLSNGTNTFHVYTWALPADPKVAATVRVRRIHLCTIVIK